ncbi:MAG TPA: alpha-amylase family glycosyl hydrolase, partial [Micavibrio sp.]
KLDHVASLGVDGIWISPFFKSPMKDFGYDVSDYRDVDPIFGTLDDYKNILDKAHSLGLKVLIDQVWSHSSDQHRWFHESRRSRDNSKADWYVWADPKPDGTAPNNWLSYFGGPAWTWDARRRQYYLHHFLSTQPTMNLWNPAVRQAIKETASFWLDMGTDGFRLDAAHTYLCDPSLADNPVRDARHPLPTDIPASNPMACQRRVNSMGLPQNLDWIEEISAHISQWPGRCLLAESGGDDSEREAVSYTQGGKRFHLAYSFGLVGTDMSKPDIVHAVQRVEDLLGDGWICWAISNHDFKRVVSRIPGRDVPLRDKALFATTLGLCLRGSYCLYQGEELGLPQADLSFEDLQDPYDKSLYPEHVGRDGCRTPMPWIKGAQHAGFSTALKTWLPVSPQHLALAADAQREEPDSILRRMIALLAWRRENRDIITGSFELIETPDPILAFRRRHGNRQMTFIFNCSETEVCFSLQGLGAGPLLAPLSNNLAVEGEKIILKPYGFGLFQK